MKTDSSNSVTEALIVLSFSDGVISFDKNATAFFSNYFQKDIKTGFSLFDILENHIASQLTEKLLVCKKGKFQLLSYSDLKNGNNFNFYLSPILEKDQRIRSVSISIELDHNSGDLVENIEIQKELDYSKQFYSNLFYNNPDAVYAFDLNGNFINVNNQAAKFSETTIEELLGTQFLPLIPVEYHEMIFEKFESVKNGENERYQCGFVGFKGTRRFLDVSNFPIKYRDKIIGVYGIAKDITEQRQVESKLLEDGQMLRAIIDNIPDYIFVKDKNHKSILANKKFHSQIIGKKPDEITVGYSPVDYFDASKAEEIIADNEMVMQSGVPVINRPDLVTSIDGKQEMVLLTKVPLKNSSNEVIGLVGIARDITETYLNNKQKDLIFKIIKAYGDKPTYAEATLKTLKIFCDNLGFEYAEAYKVGINNEKLIRTAFWPQDLDLSNKQSGQKVTYNLGEGLPGKVWQTEGVEIIRSDDGSNLLKDMMLNETESIKTAVGLPIIFEGKLISIFCFGSKLEHRKVETEILNDITIQVASAIERKRSQDQLNDFFEFSPNLIAIIGMDGFIKRINPSFERKFGFSELEILSRPFTEFIHPEDLQKTYEAIEKIAIAGSDFEMRCRKKDGNYIWISWRFSQFMESENIVFIYGTDITALKEHELQVQNSEKRFKSLVQEGSDHIAIVNCSYHYIYNSPASKSVFGLSPSEMNSTNFKDHIFKEDYPVLEDHLSKLQQTKRIQLPSYRIRNNNGDLRWLETIVTNLSEDPAIGGIVMNSRDITEFVEQERKLIASLRRYDIVAKATSDIITDYNIENHEMQVSEAAAQVFGYQSESGKYSNTWWNDKIHPDDSNSVREAVQKLIQEVQQNLTIEYRFRCADGSYKYILDRSYLIIDDAGKPLRIIGSMQDITDRKQYLIEIENHNKRLKDIAWTQSHIVRAPLAKVMGLVDLLLNYQNEFENVDEILKNILNSANELDSVIRQIAVQTEKEL